MNALAALNTAYDAWRLTQPQLFWTDENLYGLEGGGRRPENIAGSATGAFLEPVSSGTSPSPLDGLALTANGSRREPHQRARTGAEEGA